MSKRMKVAVLVVLVLILAVLFLFTHLRGDLEYVLRSRGEKSWRWCLSVGQGQCRPSYFKR